MRIHTDKDNRKLVQNHFSMIMYNMVKRSCYIRFKKMSNMLLFTFSYFLYFMIGIKYIRKNSFHPKLSKTRIFKHIMDFILGIIDDIFREPLLQVVQRGYIAKFGSYSFRRRQLHNKDKINAKIKELFRGNSRFYTGKHDYYVIDVFNDKKNKYLFSMVVREKERRDGNATKQQ